MGVAVTVLRRLQLGQEVTEGTEVNATAVFIPNGPVVATPDYTFVTPREDIGLIVDRHPGKISQKDWTLEIPFDISCEQILYALNNALKKVVAGAGAGADKSYVFNPAGAGSDQPQPFSAELRFSDGVNNIDETYVGVVASELTLQSNGLNQLSTGIWRAFARNQNANAITAALSAPASRTLFVGADWKLYSDATWAGLGTTQITAQLNAWTWTHTTPWTAKHNADGNLTPTRKKTNKRMTKLSLDLDLETSAGYVAALKAARDANPRTRLFLRLEAVGPVLGGSNYKIQIDGAYVVGSVSAPEDNDGEDKVTAELSAVYDPTGAADIRVTVVTAEGTLL